MEKQIVLVLILVIAGCTTSRERSTLPGEGNLFKDIEHATAVAWIGPHCDDEIAVVGLLALSRLYYHKDTYAVSFNEGASGFTPGATLEDRHKDNADVKTFLRLTDYVWLGLDNYKGNQKQTLFELLDEFIAGTGVDVIITFENTHGGNGHPDHIRGSQWLTEYCKTRKITLYYAINRDLVWGGKMDPLPYTDEIDLTFIIPEGSLWDVKVTVLEIYSSSVPAALNLVNSPETLEKMIRAEFYRKVT